MIFTGVNGVSMQSFNIESGKWEDLIGENQGEKFAKIVGTSKINGEPIAFIQSSDGSLKHGKFSSKMVETSKPKPKTFQPRQDKKLPDKSISIYDVEQIPLSPIAPSSDLRWTEQWTKKFEDQILGKTPNSDGNVAFSVPIINLNLSQYLKVHLALSYNDLQQNANVMGFGWNIPLLNNQIRVDYQCSIFTEDSIFSFYDLGQKMDMKREISLETQSSKVMRFSIPDQKDMEISYHTGDNSHWVIETPNERIVYGQDAKNGAVQMSLSWEKSRCGKSDTENLKKFPVTWFVKERHDKSAGGKSIYYRYTIDKKPIVQGGEIYTHSILLKSINDKKKTLVLFGYERKTLPEIPSVNAIDNGKVSFPVPLSDENFLTKVSIDFENYKQTFKFNYKVGRDKRLLVGFDQILGENSIENILKIEYSKVNSHILIRKCHLPRGSTVIFDYSLLDRKISQNSLIKKFPVDNKPLITSCAVYKVIAFTRGEKIHLRVHNGIDKDVNMEFPTGNSSFDYQVIVATHSMFFVLIATENDKKLVVFKKSGLKWTPEKVHQKFTKDVNVHVGKKFIAFAEPKDSMVKFFEWNEKESELGLSISNIESPNSQPLIQTASHGRIIIGYDDTNLIIFYQDNRDEWKVKNLKQIVGYDTTTRNTINKFDIDDEIRNQLIASAKSNLLQIDQNQIAVTKLQESDGTISVFVSLILLDAGYNAQEQVQIIKRENVFDLIFENTQNDTKLEFKYSKINDKFAVRVHDISCSDSKNQLNQGSLEQRQKNRLDTIKFINDQKAWQDSLRKAFLLDWKQYYAQLSSSGVSTGDDLVFEMTGSKWETKKPTPLTFKLSQKLILEQKDPKSNEMEFYEVEGDERKLVHSMKIQGKYVNAFPVYLAYQTSATGINVLTFTPDNKLGPIRTISDAKLLHGDFSGLTTLVNSTSFAHAEPQEINVYPLAEIIEKLPEYFVSKRTFTTGNLRRVTSYERSFEIDEDGNLSEKFVMIPGGEKNKFGWYEEIRSINGFEKAITKERKIFHASGDLKTHEITGMETKNVVENVKKEEKDFSMKLMDKSGTFEVSDLNPHKANDENFAYFGFELYENKIIGDSENNNSWVFPDSKVVHKSFSLTGENFLRLDKQEESFEGTVKPKNQNSIFVASCWIRTNVEILLNQETEIFEVDLKSSSGLKIESIQGKVKHQVGEWNYVEVIIDFKKIAEKHQTLKKHQKKPSKKVPKFEVTLRVLNEIDAMVDVDNVRFFPINHDFRVDVFNPAGQVTATIFPNGTIKRKLYNKYQQEIASIDQDGNIVEIKSTSDTGRLIVPSLKQDHPSVIAFKATENKVHDSSEWWKNWEIEGIEKKNVWNLAPGQIRHKSKLSHQILISSSLLNINSNVIRFGYALNSDESFLKFIVEGTNLLELLKVNEVTKLSIDDKSFKLPENGEIILSIENSRTIIWIDNVLIADFVSSKKFKANNSLEIEITGSVAMENFMSLNNPTITAEYFNAWGEPTQIINIESENVAQVSESLHDALGRRAITTKSTRLTRNDDQPLIAFYENFVTNDQYNDLNSVWVTHQIEGDVNEMNPKYEGFPYRRTEFEQNPSRNKKAVGLPGEEFSIIGPYSKKVKSTTEIPFLLNLFPVSKGFTMYTTINENGSKKVTVFDVNEKKVAVYARVPGSDHILSTNEYDDEGRIVKVLPPIYHEKAETATREDPWKFGYKHLSEDEKDLQKIHGSHYAYDEYGNMIKKSTPDSGTVEYVYDNDGNRRFMKLPDEKVVYFLYDDDEQLIETGHLNDSVNLKTLKTLANVTKLPAALQKVVSQEFTYSNHADDPLTRQAVKKFTTHNEDDKITEEVVFDSMDQVTKRSTLSTDQQPMKVEKTYEMNKLSTLTYPKESDSDAGLTLVHNYDKKGLLASIGKIENPTFYAQFTYTADGLIESEKVQPNSRQEFVRSYEYQAAGYLEKINDPFLTEQMTYTSDGYGQKGFGDGILSSTTFEASWADKADPKHFKVNVNDLIGDKELLTRCFKTIQQAGYLSPTGVIQKSLNFKKEEKLPVECKDKVGYLITKFMARRQIPKFYGHRYAYGNHQELTKAKYFTDERSMEAEPLQADSFSKEMENFEVEDSHEVWKMLTSEGFVITDQKNDYIESAVGKKGTKSVVRVEEIEKELTTLASPTFDALKIVHEIVNLIVRMVSRNQFTTAESFKADFLGFYGFTTESSDWQVEPLKKNAAKVFQKLSAKNLLPKHPRLLTPLNPKFVVSLRSYVARIPEILSVLSSHWTADIGESPFDVISYNIDANGNHRLFYNGYQRFEIKYQDETNKIESVKVDDITSTEPDMTFAVEHDENGNIIQAMRRNIEAIEYYVTSQRTKKITLTDGQVLTFFYDAVGERILKQVFNAEDEMQSSIKYVRDEKGQVLVDKKTIYHAKPQPKQIIVTKYIYGPRGLIGFIRNGEFMSVTTDHAGSIRLVIKNGQVVASYDYLPYGDLMRKFVTSSEYEIAYRFTGQEFDDETGLYNYHARLYDPSVGRFYQIDPKAQYFSPYLYSGNSPISFVDPDGQFAILIIAGVLAITGAYLGGAKHNSSWDPAKWNWKDPSTFLAIGGGAITGATLPFSAAALGITGSLVAGGVGLTGAYISGSAANQAFDPTKWNWKSPQTYGSLFDGFSAGFNIVYGISAANQITFANEIMKQAFVPLTITGAVGFGYYKGVAENDGNIWFWHWNWSEENMSNTLGRMFYGFSTVIAMSNAVGKRIDHFDVHKLKENPLKFLTEIKKQARDDKIHELMQRIPKPAAEIITGIIAGFLRVGGSDTFDSVFDFENFNFYEVSTYTAFYQGFLEGRHLVSGSLALKQSLGKANKSLMQKDASIQNSLVIFEESSDEKEDASTRERRSVDKVPKTSATFDGQQRNSANQNLSASYIIPYQAIHSSSPLIIHAESSHNDSSSFNILEMGDKWLQQTETIGNLTLLSLIVDKMFGSENRKTKVVKNKSKSDVEYQLIASDIVNEFIENFLESAENCGISSIVLNDILENSIDETSLSHKIEKEIRRKDFRAVLNILKKDFITKNLKSLKNHAAGNQIDELQSLIKIHFKVIEKKLESRCQ